MGRPSSLFDDLDAKFRYLITGPKPLALHGRVIGHGAPKRPIPLQELRALLAEYENWPLHDAVMRELIRRANAPTGGEPWMVAIAWMLLPALRKASGELARGFPGDPADLDAEILTGLINAVRTFGPCGPRIAWHLVDKAQLAARRLRRREARAILGLPPPPTARPSTPPGSTPAPPTPNPPSPGTTPGTCWKRPSAPAPCAPTNPPPHSARRPHPPRNRRRQRHPLQHPPPAPPPRAEPAAPAPHG